jgi:hypothetical protein
MSRKYQKLTEHLAGLDETRWRASFDDVERVLGMPLPDSARTYQAWWANQMRSQSLGWQLAGWKAVDLDLKNEKVTFVYVGGDEEAGGEGGEESGTGRVDTGVQRLTIAEAKAGLAETFGVDPGQIEITIKG